MCRFIWSFTLIYTMWGICTMRTEIETDWSKPKVYSGNSRDHRVIPNILKIMLYIKLILPCIGIFQTKFNIDWIYIFSATSPFKHWRLKYFAVEKNLKRTLKVSIRFYHFWKKTHIKPTENKIWTEKKDEGPKLKNLNLK